MAGRPRKKLTPQEQEARQEAIERRQAQRELERADRVARRQLRREREAKKKREAKANAEALAARRAELAPWPLDVFREGLALARRAGVSWQQAFHAARVAALSIAQDKSERDEWDEALYDTRTAWMRAYERRDTGFAL